MWGGVRRLPAIVLSLASSAAFCSGCGRGGVGSGVRPPPLQPGFLLALSVSSLSVEQGETSPAVSPGPADITVTAPSGSTTLSRSFQFLASSQIYANPGLYKFVLYDVSRQQVFLTATDHVDVFDLQNQVFRAAIQPPPNGPPPNAALRGLALTPDHSQLVVADFVAQSVYLIDPDGAVANGAKVAVGGVAGYLNSGPARVVATSA